MKATANKPSPKSGVVCTKEMKQSTTDLGSSRISKCQFQKRYNPAYEWKKYLGTQGALYSGLNRLVQYTKQSGV